MKQKLKRFMAGFMAMLTLVGTLFTNGTTAFAASPQANIAFWNASVKNSGEVSELKPGFNHGKILYSILDGNSAYCMNFGLRADGGQLMNSYDDASTSMSAQQRNRALTYVSTEGEPAIKQLEAEQNEQVKKKGRKAEPETVTADSAVKKQEEFEAMKKKTRNMLLGLVAVIVAAVAGIAAYKAMH